MKPHVKYINSISPTLPAPFIFFKVFSLVIFGRKHILAYQCEIERKNQQGEGRITFFSYHVVKVGEFMKLSYASEDIASRGFSRN